nr:cyclodeaminase/cyclohydrolase family protein [uncultured Allomuricauda sp.]
MDIDLLEVTTGELLEKFGAGNHKPGSGSAAAFQGMLSAKLLVTVISLTNEGKRKENYKSVLPELLRMEKKIHHEIFPQLKKLFQDDAIQFGKTIQAREDRNKEKNAFKKNQLGIKALSELKISIEIPLTIAKLCIELAVIADYVFDNGFQSARGDSQVALNGAVAGLAGCLSIVQLNLLSYGSDEIRWISKITDETNDLKNRYNQLNELATSKLEILEKEVHNNSKFFEDVEKLLDGIKSKSQISDSDIEKLASDIQNLIWLNRTTIWNKNVPDHPTKVLKPNIVLKKALGYNYAVTNRIYLSENGNEDYETAGLIDQKQRIVLVSNRFEKNVQNFTSAHELGHALLHKQTVLHRDRPIDGLGRQVSRNSIEYQADRFATHFLMPSKLIKSIFKELFLTDKFIINEDNAFNLIQDSPRKLRADSKNLRGLALKLASAESFNNQNFKSISNLFGVSISAMAIRLEELEVLEF